MNNKPRLELAFINRDVEDNIIQQRLLDGYINATSLCKAANKRWTHYFESNSTKEFVKLLSSKTGIPSSTLIQSVRGGDIQLQGTWVHPRVAINLAQWANPEFAVAVTEWILEWMQGNYSNKGNLPYHLQRYILNRNKIPSTHFSVFNEIIIALIAPLEEEGYTLPDRLVPDISEGRVFADWLRNNKNINPSNFPTYEHEYADGRKVNARLYPNELLPQFREHFNDIWLMERAVKYFTAKDITALPFLQKIIQSLPEPQRTELKAYKKGEPNEDVIGKLDEALKNTTKNNTKGKN